jgi:hypothetical protein
MVRPVIIYRVYMHYLIVIGAAGNSSQLGGISVIVCSYSASASMGNTFCGILLFIRCSVNHSGRMRVWRFPNGGPEYIHRIIVHINTTRPVGVANSIYLRTLVGISLNICCTRTSNVPVAAA